jgi:hypothetical protein
MAGIKERRVTIGRVAQTWVSDYGSGPEVNDIASAPLSTADNLPYNNKLFNRLGFEKSATCSISVTA